MTWKPLAVVLVSATLLVPTKAEALDTNGLLALVAMPLAVAAVSEVTDVPMADLMDVVTLLNDANVPPVQFVEVVRYAPVALVVEEPARTPFVQFVRTRYQAGVIGVPLVTEIEREIRFYGIPDIELDVVAPRIIDRDVDFIPIPVRNRIVEYRRNHPHGGPPGQLKKQLGLQTGAEVVHRSRRDDDGDDRDRRVSREKPRKAAKVAKAVKEHKVEKHQEKREVRESRGNDGHQEKHEGKSHGGGKGNGKGKGKGKG